MFPYPFHSENSAILSQSLQRGSTTVAAPAARRGDAGASRLVCLCVPARRQAPTPERGSQMNGRRRLAGAGLEGNQAGGSNFRKARASPAPTGSVPARGKPIRQHHVFRKIYTRSLCPLVTGFAAGSGFSFLRFLPPGIPQGHGAIEHWPCGTGVLVRREIALALELKAVARRSRRQTRL